MQTVGWICLEMLFSQFPFITSSVCDDKVLLIREYIAGHYCKLSHEFNNLTVPRLSVVLQLQILLNQ